MIASIVNQSIIGIATVQTAFLFLTRSLPDLLQPNRIRPIPEMPALSGCAPSVLSQVRQAHSFQCGLFCVQGKRI